MHYQSIFRLVLVLLLTISVSPSIAGAASQDSSAELEKKLKLQYAAIEAEFAAPPSRVDYPSDYRHVLLAWQDRLASKFSEAAVTAEALMQLDTGNADMWRERMETLRAYGKPISSPRERSVFGPGEVQKRFKVIKAPAAVYSDEARVNNIRGEVRLRVIMAADGKVINIFPIKSLAYGLTESATAAARQIQFTPAERNGEVVAQFATFVYEFRKADAAPYIPRTVF